MSRCAILDATKDVALEGLLLCFMIRFQAA